MSTISFREAIRLVHPDTNPTIKDAGEKVKTIMMYKNKPESIFKCLVQWGLVSSSYKDSNGTTKQYTPRKVINREYLSHLVSNYVYNGSVTVVLKSQYGEFKVSKTTNKRVYFTPDTVAATGMKYCDVKSVYRAWSETVSYE